MNLAKLKSQIPDIVLNELPSVMNRFEIKNLNRLSHFLGQCHHESNKFRVVTENLNYSAKGLMSIFNSSKRKLFPTLDFAKNYARQPEKIANYVYANKGGNGNVDSGDGWKFRGRGYLQTTLKNQYIDLGSFLGVDLTQNPDLVATQYPLSSAAFYFWRNGLLKRCDNGTDRSTIISVTIGINKKMLHLEERITLTNFYYNLLQKS